jgi:hypothetical protein
MKAKLKLYRIKTRARVRIIVAMSALCSSSLRASGALVQVVGEERGHGGPERGADGGCDSRGPAGGGHGRSLRGECDGGRGGEEDGAGNLLHLHLL